MREIFKKLLLHLCPANIQAPVGVLAGIGWKRAREHCRIYFLHYLPFVGLISHFSRTTTTASVSGGTPKAVKKFKRRYLTGVSLAALAEHAQRSRR